MVEITAEYNPSKDASLRERISSRRSVANSQPMQFSWNKGPPRLVLTGDTPDFDPTTIIHWKEEGYAVAYLPYSGDPKEYHRQLQHLADPLELGDKYAIVAYGDAAALTIEACLKPMPKLCALVAYYPTKLPKVTTGFPPSLHVQIHLASTQNIVTPAPGLTSYIYPRSEVGFAEEDLDEYDKVSAGLAWSRVLGCVRKGFGIDVNLERVWEEHVALEFATKDADATMATMVKEPYVNHVPTLTGGIGFTDLHRFYADFFIPSNPPSLKMRLLSRTVGTDRIVDEMHVSFKHTQSIPWLLPGVPPTDKFVEIALVSVVCIRGGKLYHEHIYWDQASVLVQIGLLDPKLVPKGFKIKEGAKGKVQRLPVVGGEAARKVVDEESEESNELVPDW